MAATKVTKVHSFHCLKAAWFSSSLIWKKKYYYVIWVCYKESSIIKKIVSRNVKKYPYHIHIVSWLVQICLGIYDIMSIIFFSKKTHNSCLILATSLFLDLIVGSLRDLFCLPKTLHVASACCALFAACFRQY